MTNQRDAEPKTPTGIEFAHSLMTDSQPGKVRRRPIKEWIAAIEAEAATEHTIADCRRAVEDHIGQSIPTEYRATLDVERLAEALQKVAESSDPDDEYPSPLDGLAYDDIASKRAARLVSVEYARLHEGE
jgi:hypothetical protein